MAASRLSPRKDLATRSGSPDSFLSSGTGDASSNALLSSSSTPPTSANDSASVSSTSLKLDDSHVADADDQDAEAEPARSEEKMSRGKRSGVVKTYNVKALSGTAMYTPRKFQKARKSQGEDEAAGSAHQRAVSGDTLIGTLGSGANASTETVVKEANRLVRDGIEALDMQWSVKKLPKSRSQIGLGTEQSPNRRKKNSEKEDDLARRRSTRSTGEQIENLTKKLSVLGKRSRNAFDASLSRGMRELKRLADTNEYAGVETKPVVTEVWANGKLVTDEPVKKKAKTEVAPAKLQKPEAPPPEKKKFKGRREKIWLTKGLYAGQDGSIDSKRKISSLPEGNSKPFMPLPIWAGERLLNLGRDFKLPFDVCSPLPPGQPKPDEWNKVSKNRFVGDAAAAWKKSTLFDDFASRCICSKQSGCDDSCQNRIMLYECDDANCSVGREYCTNRSFADLEERRRKGGKYRIGVEVIKTLDRGYGVRSNRCYNAHQIIVEYAGEIITEEECDRRMNEDYKDNDCYYLMSFDQNMIIDGTRGSIARFVNHSCEPNCRIVKWIVAGKPRMALFAGDRPIMTGEELTYDYNFDPFSSKNVQECRCGAKNCRGVLGPRLKDVKPTKAMGDVVKRAVSAGKRKLKELLSGEKDEQQPGQAKKRKIKIPKSPSGRALGAAKGLKRKLSTKLTKVSKKGKKIVVQQKVRTVKTYAASMTSSVKKEKKQTLLSSRNSSLTIVAVEDGESGKKKRNSKGKGKILKKTKVKGTLKKKVIVKRRSPKKASGDEAAQEKSTFVIGPVNEGDVVVVM